MGILSRFTGSGNVSNDPVAGAIQTGDTIQDLNNMFCNPMTQLAYQKFAIEMCVDLIATYVARTDWRYYKNKKHSSHQLESLLNVRPNPVQTSTEFFKQWVYELLMNQQALIVQINNNLYVATDFVANLTNFDKLTFSGVWIFDKQAPKKTYTQKEAFIVTPQSGDLFSLMRSFQKQYGDLLQSSVDGYQSNRTKRFIMTNPMYRTQNTEVQETFNAMLEANLKSFATATGKSAVYAKPQEVTLEDFSDKQIASASDTRLLMKDIFDRTANAFHIPPQYMFGDTLTEMQLQTLLRDAVLPIVELFQQAFNDYQFTESQYRNGTLIKADTMKLQLVDLNKVGTFIKNVLPTGTITLGDISERYLQGDALPDDLKDVRLITKNYATVEQFMNGDVVEQNTPTEEEPEIPISEESESEINE